MSIYSNFTHDGKAFHNAPRGFCAEQNRIISNEEIIKKALKDKWYLEFAKFDGRHRSLINCCVVFRQQGKFYWKRDSFSERERLYEIVWVYFAYERSQKEIDEDYRLTGTSRKEKYDIAMLSYNSCGSYVIIGDDVSVPSPPFNELSGKPKVNESALKDFIRWRDDGNQIIE